MSIPRIAITAGEPAGIGPDIVVTLAQQPCTAELVVFADPDLLKQRAHLLGMPLQLEEHDPSKAASCHKPGHLYIQRSELAEPAKPGLLNKANAPYVLSSLRSAIDRCLDRTFQAMVTAPVQKSVINDAGIPFSGHTEFLAEATETAQVVMMLATKALRVALATTHLPLSDVSAAITQASLTQGLEILHHDLNSKFGVASPKIAVLGLNPHAGEGGHLGREEIETIIPALKLLRTKGYDLVGPLPADTAFNPKTLSECDAVYAMYHDQGLPVLKYSGFGEAVNITLGLPIVRTSVDHGTALDLAGTGSASAASLGLAVEVAIECCGN